jgi:hypothetical protein
MRFDIDDDKGRTDRLRWDDLDLARVGPMRRRLGVRDRIRPSVSRSSARCSSANGSSPCT